MVLELALLRLAVPEFYNNMLDDIAVHTAKTTITAAGITADLCARHWEAASTVKNTTRDKAPSMDRRSGLRWLT